MKLVFMMETDKLVDLGSFRACSKEEIGWTEKEEVRSGMREERGDNGAFLQAKYYYLRRHLRRHPKSH